jgi:hypothetical protein
VSSPGVNPYCVDNTHALYIGCVAGIAVRHGLSVEFVDDERGVHTDHLLIKLNDAVQFTVIVPPPPPDWKLQDWLPE